ncbi:LysR family transcriptional regulator [Streptomyces acidiscabies]|uniref:LysR family transcriptional regulator n=2 Tax=Streptomyces acidiscabies TaxID=42234 RepID=A0AAP6ELC7_9ACTN|nr:LysR family transcriptional regulator [Streptomyces acidiscabies]MBZ3913645.1 LysR family transcriptional regulator [Streptomyces acidiscabies]MDX2966515.1 LysR family transcriptional regulator [Streptomyces acidiscabies]MDX3025886.1 LysR family transcriptional regulator [Streptomyces acidiscabies]MDX3796468.1 LysR family transcriptional regulator [Streptomyces acidiscabies]
MPIVRALSALGRFLTRRLAVSRTGRPVTAADALGVDHTTVSRHIPAPEKRLGLRLIERGTEGWTLTDIGRAVPENARAIEHVVDTVAGQDSPPLHGTVRVSAPDGFGAPALVRLRRRHPRLQTELITTTRQLALRPSGFDLACTIGVLPAFLTQRTRLRRLLADEIDIRLPLTLAVRREAVTHASGFSARSFHEVPAGLQVLYPVSRPRSFARHPTQHPAQRVATHVSSTSCATYRARPRHPPSPHPILQVATTRLHKVRNTGRPTPRFRTRLPPHAVQNPGGKDSRPSRPPVLSHLKGPLVRAVRRARIERGSTPMPPRACSRP